MAQRKPRQEIIEASLLPRGDALVFPNLMTQLQVYRTSSQRAVEEAMAGNRTVVVVGRRNIEEHDFNFEDLYEIATLSTITRVLKLPDGSTNLLVEGVRRVRILKSTQTEPFFKVRVEPVHDEVHDTIETKALTRAVIALFEQATRLSPHLGEEAYVAALNSTEPGLLADLVSSYLQLELAQRQKVLETLDVLDRLKLVNRLLAEETEVLELQNKVQQQVHEEMEKGQREHLLREQIRLLQRELAESDPAQRDVEGMRSRITDSGMPEDVRKRADQELDRLAQIPSISPESAVLRNYLDWLTCLPWTKETTDNLDLAQAARTLDENHYGLKEVKERILEFIAVRKLSQGRLRGPVLCFVGPPGVGKTSLGRSVAEALGRSFARVSLGGVRDEAEIRGHRRTYVGALPGRVIQTMRQAGTVNPVFVLDELDKVGADFRGDPSAALLEVLDPEHNSSFSDHYLEVPYDLSRVLFLATANVIDTIIPALRDRLEVIELPGYTEDEKLQIALRFLVPRQLSENGLEPQTLNFTPNALRRIAREYTYEAGVRNLEREIGSVCRKVARAMAQGKEVPQQITSQALPKHLGQPRFVWGLAEEQDEVGVATGVARTANGGDVLPIEVTLLEGKGDLILTGSLGEVMKESAQAALSYARSRSGELGLPVGTSLKKRDIHIHMPAGATPKDGPSAGVTLATALVSALSGRPVHKDVAMTGEVTLRGRVLEVGGIKEKVLAAHRAGIKTFLLPQKNNKDLRDIPNRVRRDLDFVLVKDMDHVLAVALLPIQGQTLA